MAKTIVSAQVSYTHGIVLMCVGVACLSANDAIAKILTSDYSPLQILFLRNVMALPVTVVIALLMGGGSALRSHRPVAHLLRGSLWVAATMMFFTSFIYLALAEATALIFVALFLVALRQAHETLTRNSSVSALIAGGTIGLAYLTRPEALVLVPAIAFYWLRGQRSEPRRWFLNLILLAAGVFALAFPYVAAFARLTRSSCIETLAQPYIVTARAKGLPRSAIIRRHLLPSSLVPSDR